MYLFGYGWEVMRMKFPVSSNIFHKYNKKRKTWISKLFQSVIFFCIFIFFAGVLYQFIATESDRNQFKMKGKYVNVGSYRLMVNTGGSGKYTVVFESDIGTPIQQWNDVREGLSKDYNLFSYDRNGYGWSDSSGEAADISKAVKDLKNALSKSGFSSPYILVGNGYGGLLMTEFAAKHPNEVAGVVLIDSIMEDEIKSKEFQSQLKKDMTKYGSYKFFSYMGGMRLAYQFNILKNNEQFLKNFSDSDKGLFKSQRIMSKYYSAYYNELKILKNYDGNIQKNGALKDTFVEVLTPANKFGDAEKDKQYVEKQKKLVSMTGKGEQMLVEKSSGYIQVDRPDAVMNAIDRIVKKVGKQ